MAAACKRRGMPEAKRLEMAGWNMGHRIALLRKTARLFAKHWNKPLNTRVGAW